MNNSKVLSDSFHRKGSGLLAVAVGGVVDIVGSIIVGVLTLIFLSIIFNSNDMSFEQFAKHHTSIKTQSIFLFVLYFGGCAVSTFAGYICARIVNYKEYKYTLILALLSSIFGYVTGSPDYLLFQKILLFILSFGFVMLGAFIRVKIKNRSYKQI